MDKNYFLVTSHQDEFLAFLKSKFKLYHLSNVFFRDIHYGIWEFLQRHNVTLQYGQSEDIARSVIATLEEKHILRKLDDRTWLLDYPQFKLMPVQKTQLDVPSAV
jgi:hypothetical protein